MARRQTRGINCLLPAAIHNEGASTQPRHKPHFTFPSTLKSRRSLLIFSPKATIASSDTRCSNLGSLLRSRRSIGDVKQTSTLLRKSIAGRALSSFQASFIFRIEKNNYKMCLASVGIEPLLALLMRLFSTLPLSLPFSLRPPSVPRAASSRSSSFALVPSRPSRSRVVRSRRSRGTVVCDSNDTSSTSWNFIILASTSLGTTTRGNENEPVGASRR